MRGKNKAKPAKKKKKKKPPPSKMTHVEEDDEEKEIPNEDDLVHGYPESKAFKTDTVISESNVFALGSGIGSDW